MGIGPEAREIERSQRSRRHPTTYSEKWKKTKKTKRINDTVFTKKNHKNVGLFVNSALVYRPKH